MRCALRVAGRCPDKRSAELLGDHVRQLNMQGPGRRRRADQLRRRGDHRGRQSVLIPRGWVRPEIVMVG